MVYADFATLVIGAPDRHHHEHLGAARDSEPPPGTTAAPVTSATTSVAESFDAFGATLPVLVDLDPQLEEGAGRELLAHAACRPP